MRVGSAEILQPDITWCGGTTAGRRIARLVEGAGLEIIPHRGGSSWGLPIALISPSCTMATAPGFGTTLTEEMVLDHRLAGRAAV